MAARTRAPSDPKEFLAWLRGEAADAAFLEQLRSYTGERRSPHAPGTTGRREDGTTPGRALQSPRTQAPPAGAEGHEPIPADRSAAVGMAPGRGQTSREDAQPGLGAIRRSTRP